MGTEQQTKDGRVVDTKGSILDDGGADQKEEYEI